jgi:hypothetical protein
VTEPDPVASLTSAVFRAWAVLARQAINANESVLRMLLESTFRETEVNLVGKRPLHLKAPAGAPLTGSSFVWVDDQTLKPADSSNPRNVLGPHNVWFDPPTAPGDGQEVVVWLRPDHPVETGDYDGTVFAAGAEVAAATVYVSGVKP